MKYVFNFFIIILLFITYSPLCFGYDDLIWNYSDDKFLENIESDVHYVSQEKNNLLESEIRKVLDIGIEYVNLTQCILTAAQKSYDVKVKQHEALIRKWEFRAKAAELIPNIDYIFDISLLTGEFLVGGIVPVTVNETPIRSTIQVNWDIANQGKTLFQMAQLSNLRRSANYNLDYTFDEVLLNTGLSYYNLLGRKLEIDVYRINLQDREEQLKMVKAKYDLGWSSKFDVLRAEAEAARAKQEYITLFNKMRYEQAKLAKVMGIDVFRTIYPIEQVIKIQNVINPDYTVDDLYKLALKNRDDVLSKKAEIRSLVQKKREVYADFIPKINLNYTHAQVGTVRLGLNTNDSVTLEVVQSLGRNLGVNTAFRAKTEGERILVEKLKLVQLERNIKESIINSYYESKTQLEKIEAAKKEVIASDESLKMSLIRMDMGEVTFIDVLQAQAAKIEARQALIQHIVDYNKSQLQTLFNIGLISKAAVLIDYSEPVIDNLSTY